MNDSIVSKRILASSVKCSVEPSRLYYPLVRRTWIPWHSVLISANLPTPFIEVIVVSVSSEKLQDSNLKQFLHMLDWLTFKNIFPIQSTLIR
jgi:hypothetical protein